MATYTWAQLKAMTSVPEVATWSEDKALLYQSMAESMLASLDLDTSMSGYTAAYNAAVIMLFDFMADNPTGLKSVSRGKVSKNFADALPPAVTMLLRSYIAGANGTLTGAKLARKDIGLR
jgi:hypothetical protein